MKVKNPAEDFLYRYNKANISLNDLLRDYARHLLVSADTYTFPMEIDKIFSHYELQVYEARLPNQRGAVTSNLEIIINSSDTQQVQLYSQAHELIEILIDFVKEHDLECLSDYQIMNLIDKKEHWCEVGAADILMPMKHFRPYVKEFGYSLHTAKSLAKSSKLSLIATIRRMLETKLRQAALVIWYWGHKPSEFGKLKQKSFFDVRPPPKLRVDYSYKSPTLTRHIRQHKSVEIDTAIGRAFQDNTGTLVRDFDYLEITSKHGRYLSEAMHISYAGQRKVVSLIFFDEQSSAEYQ